MSDSLKGVKATATFKAYCNKDVNAAEQFQKECHDLYAKVQEEAGRQMREHIEWVADRAYESGLRREDLHLVARNDGIGSSYMFIINIRDLSMLGSARLSWIHDELHIFTDSVYGSKPKEAE